MNIPIHINRRICLQLFAALCTLLLAHFGAVAQKYSFTHYNIEDGLIESQVNNITEDNDHRLWISTYGGACRFDGKEFFTISKARGLANNFLFTTFTDRNGTVWFGTNKGLSRFKEQKVFNYPIPQGATKTEIGNIAQDNLGTVWAVMHYHLFKVVKDKLEPAKLPGDPGKSISAITTDSKGRLYASFYGKGVYFLEKDKWIQYDAFDGNLKSANFFQIEFDKKTSRKLFLLSGDGLFIDSAGYINKTPYIGKGSVKGLFQTFEQDDKGNLWFGTLNGAYYLKNKVLIHFTAANGLTDNAVSSIYCDKCNNTWIGTQGAGIYRFGGDDHFMFDLSQNTKEDQIVMALSHDNRNNIILGTAGKGLLKFVDDKIERLWPEDKNNFQSNIQCLYTDQFKKIWIGSDRGGLWNYDGKTSRQITGTELQSINAISADNNGTLWVATARGFYYYENNRIAYPDGATMFSSCITAIGRDSVLIGTQEGLVLVVNKKIDKGFSLPALRSTAILCALKYGNKIYIGTDDTGLFIWDVKMAKCINYTVKDGLKSNSIYSFVKDDHGVIWVGTGRGVNRITVTPGTKGISIQQAGDSKDLVIETNESAALYDNGSVYFGTTKGLLVYKTNEDYTGSLPPHILIQNIKLFKQQKHDHSDLIDIALLKYPALSSAENHLAISFRGIYLRNPDEIKYQYKLTGLDDDFCAPVKTTSVDYPSLLPGN